MFATVQIEIPREVLHAARMTTADIQRELAVHLFAEGKLSFGKAREVAAMGLWEFQQLLASRRIPRPIIARTPGSARSPTAAVHGR